MATKPRLDQHIVPSDLRTYTKRNRDGSVRRARTEGQTTFTFALPVALKVAMKADAETADREPAELVRYALDMMIRSRWKGVQQLSMLWTTPIPEL